MFDVLLNALVESVAWIKWVLWDYYFSIVRSMVLQSPTFTILPGFKVGGWEGKDDTDICAALGGDSASFWEKHPAECFNKIEKHVTGYAILFWWPIWLYVLYTLYNKILHWVFTPKTTSTTLPSPHKHEGPPGRKRTAEQNAAAALKGAKTKADNEEKKKYYDLMLPFIRTLMIWGQEDPNRTIGDFLRLTPLPITPTLLALPSTPARGRAGSLVALE
jgi:hypothetical protein